MSTRANIKITDGHDELWFYRHSDGYPDGAMPIIDNFMKLVAEGKIRDNLGQASGWIIKLGVDEKAHLDLGSGFYDWKVGTIEPTTGEHGDIEYLYTLHLGELTVEIKSLYDDKVEVKKY